MLLSSLRYVGVHWGCKLALTLVMVMHTGTAAVWLGASDGRRAWVQAGIAVVGGQEVLYAEHKVRGHRPVLETIPWTLATPVSVRLEHDAGRWRAVAGTLHTPWVRVRHERHCYALELHGEAHAVVTVDGHVLSG